MVATAEGGCEAPTVGSGEQPDERRAKRGGRHAQVYLKNKKSVTWI